MGLEVDDIPEDKGPPIFTGNAIDMRFPDFFDDKQQPHQLWIKTFPKWAHVVYIEDKNYEVLGEDLQIGMAFTINGQLVPIIDVKPVLYHGMMIQRPQLGFPCDPFKVKKYDFKRTVDQDGINRWEIKELSTINKEN